MSLSAATILSCLALALAACGGSGEPRSPEEIARCPDCSVILVSLDTLRADHLDLYGYERETAPNLREMASRAVVFDSSVSVGSGTLTVHMSMLTSLPVKVHGVLPGNQRSLDPSHQTLAQRLQSEGLRTAAFTAGVWMYGKFGFDRGFEVYGEDIEPFPRSVEQALEWIEALGEERFFLFLHTKDAHLTGEERAYDCPTRDFFLSEVTGEFALCPDSLCTSEAVRSLELAPDATSRSDLGERVKDGDLALLRATYDGCIRSVDDALAGFLTRLERIGRYDRTLIIVTSDHGEGFLEHSRLLHSYEPYEEMIRVPLIVKLPFSAYGGRRVGELVSTLDILPTVLDALGLPPSGQAAGHSLLPAVSGGEPPRDAVYVWSPVWSALRTAEWKLIQTGDQKLLFHLGSDPGEQSNVAADHPEVTERLLERMRRAAEEEMALSSRLARRAGDDGELVVLDDDEVQRLEALGYLQ